MDEDNVSTGQLFPAGHLVFDEFAVMAHELTARAEAPMRRPHRCLQDGRGGPSAVSAIPRSKTAQTARWPSGPRFFAIPASGIR
jgi:hypothetical protein